MDSADALVVRATTTNGQEGGQGGGSGGGRNNRRGRNPGRGMHRRNGGRASRNRGHRGGRDNNNSCRSSSAGRNTNQDDGTTIIEEVTGTAHHHDVGQQAAARLGNRGQTSQARTGPTRRYQRSPAFSQGGGAGRGRWGGRSSSARGGRQGVERQVGTSRRGGTGNAGSGRNHLGRGILSENRRTTQRRNEDPGLAGGQNRQRGAPTLRTNNQHRSRNRERRAVKRRNAAAFHDFFLEGSVGYTLFPKIRSFLSIEDLVTCSMTGHTMQRDGLCKTYTVQSLVAERCQTVSKEMRVLIGTAVLNNVTKYKGKGHRPKRVARGDGSFFWANLYHPNELKQVNAIIDCFLPLASTRRSPPQYSVYDGSFGGFFNPRCIGDCLFPFIRQYLNVWDLDAFSKSGLDQRHEMCGLFTVSDILEARTTTLSQADRIRIGVEAARTVVLYKGGSTMSISRPHRVVDGLGDRWCWDNLYHPEELPLVQDFVEWCIRVLQNAIIAPELLRPSPRNLLVSASFVAGTKQLDVTLRIACLARLSGNILRLVPPPAIIDSRGKRRRQPATFHFWYTRYFGDPFPHETKYLLIRTRQAGLTEVHERVYSENVTVMLSDIVTGLNDDDIEM